VKSTSEKSREQTSALIAGIAAFGTWGLVPIFWKLLKSVSAPEILAHRFVWTIAFLAALLTWQKRWPEIRRWAAQKRAMLYCLGSGLMIGSNWLLFIWAVNVGRVIETSLGYFMTPIVNVLLGSLILRERLTPVQWSASALAAVGVVVLTLAYGQFPWVAVALCLSFGFYGLLRKQSGTPAIPGLFFETLFLVPLALTYLALLQNRNALTFGHTSAVTTILLISSGVVTALPLVWFGHAARHLRLVTLGFLQYLSPTMTFFLGVFLYHELFTRAHLITFAMIWAGLILFSGEAVLKWRSSRARQALEPAIAGEAI